MYRSGNENLRVLLYMVCRPGTTYIERIHKKQAVTCLLSWSIHQLVILLLVDVDYTCIECEIMMNTMS